MSNSSIDHLKKVIDSEFKDNDNVIHLVANTLAAEDGIAGSGVDTTVVYVPVPLQDATYVKMELLKVCLADFKEEYPLTRWQMMSCDDQALAITKVFQSAQHLINRFKELHYP